MRSNLWAGMVFMAGLFGSSTVAPVVAAEDFATAIKAGEKLQADKKPAESIKAFEEAADVAANDTEYGIAVAKKARVQAFDLTDYASARVLVDEVLAINDLHAVPKVMALEVLARCQWKGDNDPAAAAKTLDQATKLEGVDWAMPGVLLALGDCRRDGGDGAAALEAYEKVLKLPGLSKGLEAVTWLNIGITQQYALRDADAAEKAYAKALTANGSLAGEVANHRKNLAGE
jgi:tetratricopeptide (TPR) repeat protein